MDSNNISFDFASIMVAAQGIAKKLRTGEGLGLTEEKKKEFLEKAKDTDLSAKLDELEKGINDFKEKAKAINNNG